jgi:protein SCO1
MRGRMSAAWFVLLLAAACSPQGDQGRRFELTGVVAGRDAASSRVLIAHEAIEGLMPAMTMPFEVRGESPSLRDGDRIAATLVVTGTATWLEHVRITAVGAAPASEEPVAGRASPGGIVPDLPLTGQDGRSITLRDFAGRVLVVTFIYTRCPLPDFCPLMVRHLEAVRRRAAHEGMAGSLALLGVTLDPAYDTPAVLKAYGESVLAGDDRFAVWTLATGSPAEIEAVARFFGVGYRAENGLVTHTLSTAVVGHDGRVVRLFPSNAWTPDGLFEAVRTGIGRNGGQMTGLPRQAAQRMMRR